MSNSKNDNGIDLFDMFIVLLKYRKTAVIILLCTVFLLSMGFLVVPKRSFSKERLELVTEGSLTIACRSDISRYTLNGVEQSTYFADPNELFTNRRIKWIFEDMSLVYNSIESGVINKTINLSSDSVDQIKASHFGRREITDNSDWCYFFDINDYLINLHFIVGGNLENEVYDFFDSFISIANDVMLGITQDNFDYRDVLLYEDDKNLSHLSDEKLLQYAQAKGIKAGIIDPFVLISKPSVRVVSGKSLNDYKTEYLRVAIAVFLCAVLLSILIPFILEYISSIKKDNDKMALIRDALKKK